MGTISLNQSPPAPLAVGQDLLGALLDAGQQPMYLCMAGNCGRCRVRVIAGEDLLAEPNRAEQHHGATGPERLACQALLASDGAVAVSQG